MDKFLRGENGKPFQPKAKAEPKAKPEAKKRGRPPKSDLAVELEQVPTRAYTSPADRVLERLQALEAVSPATEEMVELRRKLAEREAEIAALRSQTSAVVGAAVELSGAEQLEAAMSCIVTPPTKKSFELLLAEAHKIHAITSPGSDLSTKDQQGQLGAAMGKALSASSAEAGAVGAEFGHLGAAQGRQAGKAGAASGKDGAGFGKLGGQYGWLGGRPRGKRLFEEDDEPRGAQPDQWLQSHVNPRRSEAGAAAVLKFQEFVRTKLTEAGKTDSDMDAHFMRNKVQRLFPGKSTRKLMAMWNQTEKAARVAELELGNRGGARKKGEHSILRLHLGKGIRALAKPDSNKKSAFESMFKQVEGTFQKWRSAGQYVDQYDLLSEFKDLLEAKIDSLEGELKITGGLVASKALLLKRCLTKRDKMALHERNQAKTVQQMQKQFGCRLLKPQRLCSMTLEEEAERVSETWYLFDFVMWLAAFAEIEELGEHVLNPEEFRKNVRSTVICMSDQMPFYIKLQPGKQMYTKDEIASSKRKPLSEREKEEGMGRKTGGGSQKAVAISSLDEFEIDNEGMTQTRGESHGNQDKFRVTVDVEQVLTGFFSADAEPQAVWGLTSLIMVGAHFNEDNVSNPTGKGERPVYLEDEVYTVDGKDIVHKKGEPIERGRGSAILKFREDHPVLYEEMKDMGIRFYQQPAGFEGRGALGRGGGILRWGHIKILYEAPTNYTKPQQTIQRL